MIKNIATSTWLMSLDILVALRDKDENEFSGAFISCRCRLNIMLAGASRGKRREVGMEEVKWDYRMFILGDCQDWRTSWYAILNWRWTWLGWHQGVCEWHRQTSIIGKGADRICCGWVPVGQSSQPTSGPVSIYTFQEHLICFSNVKCN